MSSSLSPFHKVLSSPTTATTSGNPQEARSIGETKVRWPSNGHVVPSSASSSPPQKQPSTSPTTEAALNFAFFSFLGFTIIQFVFAIAARSQSMMTDCAAMVVDVMTYLFNYGAERMKHNLDDVTRNTNNSDNNRNDHNNDNVDDDDLSSEGDDDRGKLPRLLLELIPPAISASTLIVVTIVALKQAVETILTGDDGDIVKSDNDAASDTANNPNEDPPDVMIMLIFSALNLILDALNVMEFARVDHLVVQSVTDVRHPHPHHNHHHHHHHDHHHHHHSAVPSENRLEHQQLRPDGVAVTEATSLLNGGILLDDYNGKTAVADDVENKIGNNKDDDENDDNASNNTMSEPDLNLNMCSAWTHIAADTLRSVAVLLASGFSALFPSILSATDADSIGAILVSVVILLSLLPLLQGLFYTSIEIYDILIVLRGNNRREGGCV